MENFVWLYGWKEKYGFIMTSENINNENENYKNITFIEYFFKKYLDRTIADNVASVLYSNTNTNSNSQEQQEPQISISKRDKFIYSLSFQEWFDLYGIYTLRKIKNKFLKYLFVFILINILLLLSTSISGLLQKEYRMQNALLRPADFITKAYIYPLSKIFGYENILTLPFYAVRNLLYNKGISLLPNDSPEKIVWWYSIRFVEFASVDEPGLRDRFIDGKEITDRQTIKLKNWNDEIYNQILLLKTADLSKTIYKDDKLLILRDLITFYNKGVGRLRTMLFFKKYKNYKQGQIYPTISDSQDMTMFLLEDFDKLKEDLHKINSNDYRKYINQPIIEEYIFKRNCTWNVLSYKGKTEKINCTDPAAIIYHDMGLKIIKNLIINFNNLSSSQKDKAHLSLYGGGTGLYHFCPELNKEYENAYKEYNSFILNNKKEK